MNVYNEGDCTKAVCENCKCIAYVVFKARDYEFEDGRIVGNILQGFCETCGERLLLPIQSARILRHYRLLFMFDTDVNSANFKRSDYLIESDLLCSEGYLKELLSNFVRFSPKKEFEDFVAYKEKIKLVYRKLGYELPDKLKRFLCNAQYDGYMQILYDFGN